MTNANTKATKAATETTMTNANTKATKAATVQCPLCLSGSGVACTSRASGKPAAMHAARITRAASDLAAASRPRSRLTTRFRVGASLAEQAADLARQAAECAEALTEDGDRVAARCSARAARHLLRASAALAEAWL